MKQLIDRMQSVIFYKGDKVEIDEFIRLKIKLYKSYGKGFYVHAPQVNLKGKAIKQMIEYVTRYAGHPAIRNLESLNIIKKLRLFLIIMTHMKMMLSLMKMIR